MGDSPGLNAIDSSRYVIVTGINPTIPSSLKHVQTAQRTKFPSRSVSNKAGSKRFNWRLAKSHSKSNLASSDGTQFPLRFLTRATYGRTHTLFIVSFSLGPLRKVPPALKFHRGYPFGNLPSTVKFSFGSRGSAKHRLSTYPRKPP